MKKSVLLTITCFFSVNAMNDEATQKLFNIIYEKKDAECSEIQKALNEHADVNGHDKTQRTPLEIAAFLGKISMFSFLVKHNATITEQCLCYAVSAKRNAMVALLINQHHVNVNATMNNRSALYCAIRSGDKSMIFGLLGAGAQISQDDYGWGVQIDDLLKQYDKNRKS